MLTDEDRAELIGQTIWDDPVVKVVVTVGIAPWHDDPVEAAKRLVRDGLAQSRGTITNWGGRFAIVLDIAGDGGEIEIEPLVKEITDA